MFKIFLFLLTLHVFLLADEIDNKIAKMLVVGFEGYDVNKSDELFEYPLGGVILFDKNIKNPQQLEKLTFKLKRFSKDRLLVCVDEEGGLVSRLGKVEGFIKTPSAKNIAKEGKDKAVESYEKMADMLKAMGINCNLAPSVDLAINPKNRVIVKSKRSYGKNPDIVGSYGEIFIRQMHKKGVISVLKHFPGHGSSMGDSHDGFVDVSDSWSKKELEPFKKLIDGGFADVIMTAHIFNKHIDEKYPATLSKKTNLELLRRKLKFTGVLMSDDMQMGAIRKHYSLKKSLKLAINSSVDLLLFGNQISKPVRIKEIVKTIRELVESKEVDISVIELANERVEKLKRGIK
jgi:beta-N-acetylhexosaminidase